MKKLILLLFFIVCISANNSYSQNFFREGFIEKNSGVVLIGMVEYKPNQKIPAKCVFKRFDIASKVSYSPEDIKAFGYKNGNRYESIRTEGKSSFFEVLVIGKITLYTRGSDYFIDKERRGLVKIEDGPVEYMENGSKKEFEGLESFLAYLTEGNAGGIKTDFKIKKDLLPLIIAYNKGSGKDYHAFNRSYSEQQLANQTSLSGLNRNRFGIITGANLYNLNIKPFVVRANDTGDSYAPDSGFETGPIIGISYERSLLRKSEKFSARLEFYYTRQNFYCYKETNIITINRNEVFYDFTAVKIPVLLQYAITGKRVVPFFNAGVAYQHLLTGNYRHVLEIENNFGEISTFEDSKFEFKNGETTAIAGFGAKFRLMNKLNLNLQTRFEIGTGLFENSYPEKQFSKPSYRKPYIQNSMQADIILGITF